VRYRRALTALGVAALVVGGVVGATAGGKALCRRSGFFQVRQVEVAGAAHLRVDTLLSALGLAPRASACDDLDGAEERVASIAGVAEAHVGRRLPGTVVLHVVEERAVAFVPGPKGLDAVDVGGRVLAFDPALAPLDLPIATTADSALLSVLDRVQRVDPALAQQVTEARLVHSSAVLQLGGARVVFDPEATPPVIRAVSLVAQDLEMRGRTWRELDARFDGQIVVRLREGG